MEFNGKNMTFLTLNITHFNNIYNMMKIINVFNSKIMFSILILCEKHHVIFHWIYIKFPPHLICNISGYI